MKRSIIVLITLVGIRSLKAAELEGQLGNLTLSEKPKDTLPLNPYTPKISQAELDFLNRRLDEIDRLQQQKFLEEMPCFAIDSESEYIIKDFLSTTPMTTASRLQAVEKKVEFNDALLGDLKRDYHSFVKYFNEPASSENKNADLIKILTNLKREATIKFTEKDEKIKFNDLSNLFMRGSERDLAALMFKYYLCKSLPSKWLTSVFNQGKFSSSSRFATLFKLLSYRGPGNSVDRENLFFVRNFELFELFYAYLSRDPMKIRKAYQQYHEMVQATGWELYERPGGYFGLE